jgi:hypothetical protein
MALNYSIAMMGNPMNQEEAKKAYAKAQVSQELSLKALAKRVSSQTTASRAMSRPHSSHSMPNTRSVSAAGTVCSQPSPAPTWENSGYR